MDRKTAVLWRCVAQRVLDLDVVRPGRPVDEVSWTAAVGCTKPWKGNLGVGDAEQALLPSGIRAGLGMQLCQLCTSRA